MSTGAARPAAAGYFDCLEAADRAELERRGRSRRLAGGVVLIHDGQPAEDVFIIRTGRFKVTALSTRGTETILAFRGPGELVGEAGIFDGAGRAASVTTIEPAEVLVLSAESFLAFIAASPAASLALIGLLARRLRDADRKRIEFAALDTTGRLAARLIELCERFGDPDARELTIDIALTQEELAGWTGSSLEAVVKALRRLREAGWIATERRRVVVHDLEALRRLAQ